MKKNKSSVSKGSSYEEIGEFWDRHDLTKLWNRTKKVRFEVQIDSETIYYAVEKTLSEKIQSLAKRRGVSSDTLINLWIQQRLEEEISQ